MIAAGFDWPQAILMFVALLISLTAHEAAHALFAKLGGDLTAYRSGQVSLNPLPHIQREPFGMIVFPALSLLLTNGQSTIGFAHTPIDPAWAYHNPRKAALMSAAGPLANLLLAAIAFTVLAIMGRPTSDTGDAIERIAGTFLLLNLLLFEFNLLVPLPPLDGAGIIEGLVPSTRRFFDFLRRQPFTGLLTLFIAIKAVPLVFEPTLHMVLGWLVQLR